MGYLILIVKQGGIQYHFFKSLDMIQPGTEPQSPGPMGQLLKLQF